MKTLLLGFAGAVVGLVGWALCGLGLTELGITALFDPMNVGSDLPDPTTFESTLEWSFPVWIGFGAALLPKFARWALRPPASFDDPDRSEP